ncbi:hypothetical protein SAMN05660297_01190 [Natronincola peptidivorans]|uniref:Uncharacterized protein n=1 Tax=Natronincola peptidivorans TaxID=426128 RepID=A0A1I0B565_9FIRM|nr:hypothetical protein SAMN05660297_01190 [Natronincola peptidivorans]
MGISFGTLQAKTPDDKKIIEILMEKGNVHQQKAKEAGVRLELFTYLLMLLPPAF